jgi:hypothetical protein
VQYLQKNRVVKYTILLEIVFNVVPGYSAVAFNIVCFQTSLNLHISKIFPPSDFGRPLINNCWRIRIGFLRNGCGHLFTALFETVSQEETNKFHWNWNHPSCSAHEQHFIKDMNIILN